ncbi:MAG TPA: AsmA family protein, partial [Rhodopila sp.]
MTLRRPLRIALIAIAAVIVLALGGGAVFVANFDPNTLKPRIIEAVKRATGRDLVLNGKIGLEFALRPTIRVKDVAFANPPGFSRPQMATLQSMQLELGLLPLLSHRIEIDHLVLVHPDILLETAANGQPNWVMKPEVSPEAPAASKPGAPSAPGVPTTVSVNTIRIQDGTIAYRDDVTGNVTAIGVPKLDATSASPDSPMHLAVDAVYNGTAFNLAADTGSLARLQDLAATSAWPVKLALTVGAAKLTADGSMTQPLRGKGYQLAVSGSVPDTAALTPLLQGVVPPPLHDVGFTAKVADSGGRLPEVSALTLHVGTSDLSAQIAGLHVDKLDIDAPKTDQPMKIAAAVRLGDLPLTVAGTFGPPALLLPDAKPAPFPVDLTLQAATATVSAKGAIADVRALTGVNVAVTAQIPDLSVLSPLAGRPLPAIKTVAFQGSLADADGGFRHGAALHGITLTSADGDLSGDASIGLAARPSLTADLKSSRFDLDALQAAIDQVPDAAASTSAPNTASPPRPAKRRGEALFSNQPIPVALLRSADADLKLDIADLHTGGTDYKAIDAHAVLSNGKLTVDPFAGNVPGGHLSGTLTVDAAQSSPPVRVVL